jgi:broad specificity phosphatase PhoE
MDDVVVARHGESETAARRLVGGDAPLTERGRAQAEALGAALAGVPLDVCVTSGARRAVETADVALRDRDVPRETLETLRDIDFGDFEGRPLDEYRTWIAAHPPDEAPPGGESRVATLRRFCRAYRALLARPERHVVVVAHGLTVSALTDDVPRPLVAGVEYGSFVRLTRDELGAAVTRLERWCEAPAW